MSSGTPDSSNMIRPGLTLATHHSGEPLPDPMRDSAGFLVSGRSGELEIHTFPPRLMCRVMAIRADSICRFVTYAGSRAWIAYSPKLIAVPPLALPPRSGWCCLRCLTRRGMSMASGPLFRIRSVLGGRRVGGSGLGGRGGLRAGDLGDGRLGRDLARGHGHGALGGVGSGNGRPLGCGAAGLGAAGGRARRTGTTLGTLGPLTALLTGGEGLEGLPLGPRATDVTLVDPDLHTDAAEGRTGLVDAVVDVRAEGVQRHATLAVELRPAHLRAAQATRALHPDPLDLRAALGRLHGLAHGPAEADAAGELLRATLAAQLRIRLGFLDLEDVQLHLLAGELLELTADAVGLRAATADDDARPRGVDVDTDPVTGALDLDLGDAGPLHALGHELADRDVFLDVVLVQLVRVPPGLVVGGDPESEPVRVDLLTH